MPSKEPRILTLDESRPTLTMRRPATTIAFANPRQRPIDREQLTTTLTECGFARKINTVTIEADSLLTSPWVVEFFPNTRFVCLAGGKLENLEGLEGLRKLSRMDIDTISKKRSLVLLPKLGLKELSIRMVRPDDHAMLGECSTLEELHAVGWKETDLKSLSGVAPRILQMERSAITSLNGLNTSHLQHLMLQRCSALIDVGGVSARSLTIEACNALHGMSLIRVEGLTSLVFMSQKSIDTLEFVRGCPSLGHLHLACDGIKNLNFQPLVESPSLRFVWISTGNRELVADIARQNPRLTIACHLATYTGSKGTNGSARYDKLFRAFAKENDLPVI